MVWHNQNVTCHYSIRTRSQRGQPSRRAMGTKPTNLLLPQGRWFTYSSSPEGLGNSSSSNGEQRTYIFHEMVEGRKDPFAHRPQYQSPCMEGSGRHQEHFRIWDPNSSSLTQRIPCTWCRDLCQRWQQDGLGCEHLCFAHAWRTT
ncbi:hypothetical protein ES702_05199 [subsurface metagenome]